MLFWPWPTEPLSLVDFACFFAALRRGGGEWRVVVVEGDQDGGRSRGIWRRRGEAGAPQYGQTASSSAVPRVSDLAARGWRWRWRCWWWWWRWRPCNSATLERRRPHLSHWQPSHPASHPASQPAIQPPSDAPTSASARDVGGDSSAEGRRDGEMDGRMSQVPRWRGEETSGRAVGWGGSSSRLGVGQQDLLNAFRSGNFLRDE